MKLSDNQQAWNRQATRYFQKANLAYDVVDYGDPRCATDETLHLLPDVAGQTVLELGCGGGNIGIALAKRGARVTGIDLSAAQLQIAAQKAREHGVVVRYLEGDLDTLALAQFAPVDLVISVCAFQYVAELPRLFAQVYAALRPGGAFIFSTDDPAFYSVAAKFLWHAPDPQQTYFYTGPDVWKWEETDDFSFTTYRHPIDFYINTLISLGFTLQRFHQLAIPHPEGARTEEERLESLYPRLMVFKCLK